MAATCLVGGPLFRVLFCELLGVLEEFLLVLGIFLWGGGGEEEGGRGGGRKVET